MKSYARSHPSHYPRIPSAPCSDNAVQVSYRCCPSSEGLPIEPGPVSECWQRGFPYEGRAAEVLELAGLWSRSRWMHFLRGKGQSAPGDALSYSLGDIHSVKGEIMQAALIIRDDEQGKWHVIIVDRGGRYE